MLLPILDYRSLNDQEGDRNIDSSPAFSLKSAFHSGQKKSGQNKAIMTEGQGNPRPIQ